MRCYTCKQTDESVEFESKSSKQCSKCKVKTTKLCPDCGKEKDKSEFKYAGSDRLYGYCTPCRKTRSQKYHKDRIARDPEGQRLRGLMNSRNRDKGVQKLRRDEWRKRNPRVEKTNDQKFYHMGGRSNQRSRRDGFPGSIRTYDIKFIESKVGRVCQCDQGHLIDENNPINIDHVKPLIKGGRNCVHNIQFLCRLCNMRKGRSEFDFRTRELVEAINEEYPECSMVEDGTPCRTRFEIGAGILVGHPEWEEDKE